MRDNLKKKIESEISFKFVPTPELFHMVSYVYDILAFVFNSSRNV
jgi:hypothetical protein